MSHLDAVNDWVEKAKLARYNANALAKLCLVSSSQLRRYFNQVFGKTPQKWLDELRQIHAARLLLSGLSVKEVVFQLHFKQEAQFYHHFRYHHHRTPMEFLVHCRQDAHQTARLPLGKNFDPATLVSSAQEIEEINHCRKIRTAHFGNNMQNARQRH